MIAQMFLEVRTREGIPRSGSNRIPADSATPIGAFGTADYRFTTGGARIAAIYADARDRLRQVGVRFVFAPVDGANHGWVLCAWGNTSMRTLPVIAHFLCGS
jgi:hypothetical protein